MKHERVYGLYNDGWQGLIIDESFSHPAKFSRGLIYWIIKTGIERGWWAPGVTHLIDPFAGVALGGLAAAAHGLAWTGVELEEKFVSLGKQNIDLHCAEYERMGYPVPQIIQGDSRRLIEVLREHGMVAGASVTSPPWVDSLDRGVVDKQERVAEARRRGISNAEFLSPIDLEHLRLQTYGSTPGQLGAMPEGAPPVGAVTSPPYAREPDRGGIDLSGQSYGPHSQANVERYGQTAGQIANLGGITSPPYGETLGAEGRRSGIDWSKQKGADRRSQPDKPHGYDGGGYAAVTSPPFSQPDTRDRYPVQDGSISDAMTRAHTVDRQVQTEGNIAAMGGITSPPYEGQVVKARSSHLEAGRLKAKGKIDAPYGMTGDTLAFEAYSDNPENLGNTQGETYWGAIQQVLDQLWLLFPSGGMLAWVVKPFVRNKKIVDLPQMTLDLMLAQGWEPVVEIQAMLISEAEQGHLLLDRTYRKKEVSFFRGLHEKMCVHRGKKPKGASRYECKLLSEECPYYGPGRISKPDYCELYLSNADRGLAIDAETVLVVRKP